MERPENRYFAQTAGTGHTQKDLRTFFLHSYLGCRVYGVLGHEGFGDSTVPILHQMFLYVLLYSFLLLTGCFAL